MSSVGIASVEQYTICAKRLLQKAQELKPSNDIEPALVASDFDGGIERLIRINPDFTASNEQAHYAAIETAFRNIFYELLASRSINEPSFSEVWNLLDIVTILSDDEQCEPGLIFWLVEELLDSQTIDGCRVVFDYLDSRRERVTARHFKQKHLIILRACNELLRRLSRAEDTVFCGRVFIFLFQSFPLGDRSSVNLRGEYHVENVTTYDKELLPSTAEADPMLIDNDGNTEQTLDTTSKPISQNSSVTKEETSEVLNTTTKSVKIDQKIDIKDPFLDLDTLYPIFWSLQENFSTPTRLFEDANFRSFKFGLERTILKFKEVHKDQETRGNTKVSDESRRGIKRKRGGVGDESSSNFNPKYLTSRDLFGLEVSDLAFRRHILVQALILIDFLLSLTTKAKGKLEAMTNKSVLYSYILSEDDTIWAARMKSEIAAYLQEGPEGKFYYRMVDTVLSRDKNWVRWKAEGCPPIERPPISVDDYESARSGAQKACAGKRLRATPLGSLDLSFLADAANEDGMEKLKTPARYTVPSLDDFRAKIQEDDFDIEMAKTEEDKQLAINARASKMWRTLRIASKSRLNLLDKIDDGNNFQALFEPETPDITNMKDDDDTTGPSKDSVTHDVVLQQAADHDIESVQPKDNITV